LIPQALDLNVPDELPAEPAGPPTILSFGAARAMKRGLHVLRAFELAKREIPELRFVVAGDLSGRYGRKLAAAIAASPHRADIDTLGRVAAANRASVFRRAHLLCAASVKEGWGLVVSEAAAQGVPSVVYDVDGLRDSVKDGDTGVVVKRGDPEAMGKAIIELMKDGKRRAALRERGWSTLRPGGLQSSVREFIAALQGH
jgi:glycosyltransferase involved in cell wall biosynthesis